MKRTILLVFVVMLFGSLIAEESAGSLGWDDRGYLVFKSDDGNFQMRLDTRIYINGSYFLDDPEEILSNQFNLRKARFAVKARLWKYWSFEWDIDIAEGNLVEVKDMYACYDGFKSSHLKFGNFKQAMGMEELTSSRLLVFPERAMVMLAFETDRQFGLEYSTWGELGKIPFNWRSSIFTQTLTNESKSDYEKDVDETGIGAAARLAMAPQINEDILFHGGLAIAYETPHDESEILEYKSEAETKNGDLEWLDSGKIREADYSLKYGFEGAFQYKSFHLQAEYIQANVFRLEDSDLKDASFEGGYAYLAWLITGEKRPWITSEGEFGQVIPKSNKTGAWELAARYSHLNLNDEKADIYGGAANIITLGLNWYANPNVKVQLAYSMVDLSENANSDGDYIFDNGTPIYEEGYDFNYLQFMTIFYF